MTLSRCLSVILCLSLLLVCCFGCAPKQITINTENEEYQVTASAVRAFICVYFYEASQSGNQEEFENISRRHAKFISELTDEPNSQYQLFGYSYGLLISYYWEVVNLSKEEQSYITGQYADRLTKKILQDHWTNDR